MSHPATHEPFSLADWLMVFCGRLKLPCADEISVSDAQAAGASMRLLELIEGAVAPLALAPRTSLEKIVEAYPVKDRRRQQRLREFVLRGHHLDPEVLEEELPAMAETIANLKGIPAQKFTERDLWPELIKDRRRT